MEAPTGKQTLIYNTLFCMSADGMAPPIKLLQELRKSPTLSSPLLSSLNPSSNSFKSDIDTAKWSKRSRP